MGISLSQGLFLGNGVGISSETHADDISTIGHGIVDALDDGGHVARSVALHHGDGHDEGVGVGTGDADAVVAHRSCNAGAVGAVSVPVAQASGLVHKVVAVQVVGITVAVVVHLLFALALVCIGPDVVHQVRVRDVHTRVEDGDDGALAADNRLLPQLRHTDGRQSPLHAVEGFAGIFVALRQGVNHIVGFGQFHLAQRFQVLHHTMHVKAVADTEAQAIEARHVVLRNDLSVVGTDTGGRHVPAGHRHEGFHLRHTHTAEQAVHALCIGATGAGIDIHTLLEFHNHLALAIGAVVVTVQLHNLFFVVAILRHRAAGKQCPQRNHRDK